MAAESAHKYGKWAGICGELGADLDLTEEFVKMGIDETVCIALHDPALEKTNQRAGIAGETCNFPLHV